jgi:hypothetical protein
MLEVPGLPGLPLPDLVPKVLYVLFSDGMLGQVTTTAGVEPVLAEGAKFVTQDRYEELRAQMRERHEARLAEMHAEEQAIKRQTYEDLRTIGTPEVTARALSGYDGPAADAES